MANRAQTFTVGTTKYDLFSNKLVIKPGGKAPITFTLDVYYPSSKLEQVVDFYRHYSHRGHPHQGLVLMNTDIKNGNGTYIIKMKTIEAGKNPIIFKQEIPENVYAAIVTKFDKAIDDYEYIYSNNELGSNINSNTNSNENTSFRRPASGGRRRKTMKRRVSKKKKTQRRR